MSSKRLPSLPPGALRAEGLGKSYRHYRRPADWLKERILRRPFAEERWVLHGIDFSLDPGQALGIIGRNGAGKSTLLQIVAGTLTPTVGTLRKNGRVAALLELGAGFNPEFTGRENARLNAALMGLTPDEIDERLPEIIAFSGIGEAIDRPVKTYSSGMFVRLAFAVATAVDPDILIIDEALSVGDGAFARKSFDRIMEIREQGASILFCSHSLYQVERLCTRALWIEAGRIRMEGASRKVIRAYEDFLNTQAESTPILSDHSSQTIDSPIPHIRQVTVFRDGIKTNDNPIIIQTNQTSLAFTLEIETPKNIPWPRVAISIYTQSGICVFGTGNLDNPSALKPIDDTRATVTFHLPKIPLLPGSYRVDIGIFCEQGLHFYEVISPFIHLDVSHSDATQGLVILPHQWN